MFAALCTLRHLSVMVLIPDGLVSTVLSNYGQFQTFAPHCSAGSFST